MVACRDGLGNTCNIREITAIIVQTEIEHQTILLFAVIAIHIHLPLLILAESADEFFISIALIPSVEFHILAFIDNSIAYELVVRHPHRMVVTTAVGRWCLAILKMMIGINPHLFQLQHLSLWNSSISNQTNG